MIPHYLILNTKCKMQSQHILFPITCSPNPECNLVSGGFAGKTEMLASVHFQIIIHDKPYDERE